MEEKKEYTNRSSKTKVILQGLFIIVLVFVLTWFFPMKGELEKKLEPLYQQKFNENIKTMKEAAKTYFNTTRLPDEIGKSIHLTLGDMYNKKLLAPLFDSQNDSCDTSDSYVEVTKSAENYHLKVNLQCSDKSDYLIVPMGNYNYCETTLCEATKETTEQSNNKTNNDNPKPIKNEGTIYYEYYTETIKKVPYETIEKVPYIVKYLEDMCIYRKVNRKNLNLYSVSTISANRNYYDEGFTLNYGFILEDNVKTDTIKLIDVAYGKDNFNLSTYLSQRSNGVVYNYDYSSESAVANTPTSTSTFNASALNSKQISFIDVNRTLNYSNVSIIRDWNTPNGYKLDYRFYLNDSSIDKAISNGTLNSYYNYYYGYIYFIPVKFKIQYDVVFKDMLTKECDELNTAEKEYILDKYQETKYQTKYYDKVVVKYKKVTEKSQMKWTTKKNVKGYIYTGVTKVVK